MPPPDPPDPPPPPPVTDDPDPKEVNPVPPLKTELIIAMPFEPLTPPLLLLVDPPPKKPLIIPPPAADATELPPFEAIGLDVPAEEEDDDIEEGDSDGQENEFAPKSFAKDGDDRGEGDAVEVEAEVVFIFGKDGKDEDADEDDAGEENAEKAEKDENDDTD